jgi:hypothetical protein
VKSKWRHIADGEENFICVGMGRGEGGGLFSD